MSPLTALKRLYAGRISVGDRLGEAFYAVWMAVISIGLLNSVSQITPDHVLWVIGVCLSVNITWGIIDGVTVTYTNVMARAASDRVLYALRTGAPGARQIAADHLENTALSGIDAATRERVLDELAADPAGSDPAKHRYRPTREEWLYALGILLIDAGLALPVIAPFFVISDIQTAVYVSRLIATLMFAAIGWAYAKNLNRNPWIASVALGLLGFIVFTRAYQTGW